jgi:hypothetical protein
LYPNNYSNVSVYENWQYTVYSLGDLTVGNYYLDYITSILLYATESWAILKFSLPPDLNNKTIKSAKIKIHGFKNTSSSVL